MSTAERPPRPGPRGPIIRLPVGDEVIFEEPYRNPDKHTLPDHNPLPDHDETIAENCQERPQSRLPTDSIAPFRDRRHP